MNAGDQINEEFNILDRQLEDEDRTSDTETGYDAAGARKLITYDETFDKVFVTRTTCKLGYMAMVSALRFQIYNMYDDQLGQVEYYMVWDNDLRFNKALRSLGKIISLDFENDLKTFITGTNLGWICVWDLENKQHLRKFQVLDGTRPDQCNLVRDFSNEKIIVSYSNKTMNLYIAKLVQKTVEIKNIAN